MNEERRAKFFQRHPIVKDVCSLGSFVICVIVGTLILNAFVFRSYNVVGSSMENTFFNDDRVIVNRLEVSLQHFLGNEYVPKRGNVIVFVNEDYELVRAYRWLAKAEELGIDVSILKQSKFESVADLVVIAEKNNIELPTELNNYSADFKEMGNFTTCDVPKNIRDQYIIKRVIAFPGERVVVKDGIMTIYNEEHPDGFVYDDEWRIGETEGPKKYTSGEIDTIVPEGEIFVSGDNREGQNSMDSRNGLGTIPFCRIIGTVNMRIFPFDRLKFF